MSITKYYRVSITIPASIADHIGDKIDDDEYDKKTIEATKGHIKAGSNWESDLEEWAEFSTLEDAQACERKLLDVIYYFASKLGEN